MSRPGHYKSRAAAEESASKQRRRERRESRGHITAPFASTQKGKEAEHRYQRTGSTKPVVFHNDATTTGPSLPSVPSPSTIISALIDQQNLPGSSSLRDYGKSEAENLAQVLKEHNLENPGQYNLLPDSKQLRAASVVLSPVGGEGATKVASNLESGVSALAASEKAAQAAGAGAKVVRGVVRSRGAVRGAVGRAAAKAEPDFLRAARQAAAKRAGSAASKLPEPVKAAGKVAGQAASFPVRRPLTAPLAFQAPAALIHGNPGEFLKALEGQGTLATIGNTLGSAASSVIPSTAAQNLVKDAFNLPAVALPSVYLPLAGAVEAAQGDPSRLTGLLDQYKKTGLLPAIFRGDTGAALKALENHPLYSALEVSGAASAAGRGAGALVRGATKGELGGLERPPVPIKGLEHYGNVNEILGRGRYSPDLFRQLLQRGYDSRRAHKTGGFATDRQAGRVVRRDLPDRYAYEREQLRRVGREQITKAMHGAEPKKGRFKVDKASADVVSLAVQKIIRSPETFNEDLRKYRGQLEQAAKSGEMTKAELSANRTLIKHVDHAIESANPEAVVHAANHFIELHGKLVNNIVDQGLLDSQQAAKAAAIPFARVHMGADYKKGVGVVDAQGKPLSLDAIHAEMDRHGVEKPGFLTHQPRTASARGAWYRTFFPERQSLSRQARTGAAAAHGSFDASYRALVEQAARSRSVVDATGGFDGLLHNYGIKAPEGVKDLNTAHDALQNPDRYGWTPPDVPLRPIRTAPFLALKRELAAAARHQDLLDPQNAPQLQGLAEKTLQQAEQPGSGPVAFVPDKLYGRLLEHFHPSNTAEKGVQLANTAFKGAVLPFSPSFYVGNVADNYLRAALSGIGPSDIYLGYKLHRNLESPGAQESLAPGALYSSFKRVQPYRDARQFEGTPLAGIARGLHALRETPGPKQAANFFVHTRNFLLELNSRISERLPQYGGIGKEARRELQATTGYWHHALMVSNGAFDDLLKGLRGTDKQIQYAKAVEQTFGNWGKNGPAARGVLANLVPFWQWARASTRFVLLTLPAHHPIKTGLIAAAADMTEKERKQFGLDKFADEPLPGFLQGSIPSGGGVLRNLPKYTSFGVFGDYPEFLGRMFFAQGSTPLQALQGLDWKGDKLAKADGSPMNDLERTKVAILSTGEQFLPGVNLIEGALGGELSKFNPLAVEEAEKLNYFRGLSKSQQITVPASGSSSSSSGAPWRSESSSSSGSAPWKTESSGSSETAPWK